MFWKEWLKGRTVKVIIFKSKCTHLVLTVWDTKQLLWDDIIRDISLPYIVTVGDATLAVLVVREQNSSALNLKGQKSDDKYSSSYSFTYLLLFTCILSSFQRGSVTISKIERKERLASQTINKFRWQYSIDSELSWRESTG